MTGESEDDSSSKTGAPPKGTQDAADSSKQPAVTVPKDQKQPVEHGGNRRHEPKHPVDVAALVVAAIALIVAGVGAYVAWLQYGSMRVQQQIMQGQLDAMVADQRPWVFIQKASIVSPLVYDNSGLNITLQWQIKNSGKTTAFNVSSHAFLLIASDEDDISPRKFARELCDQDRSIGNTRRQIFDINSSFGYILKPEGIIEEPSNTFSLERKDVEAALSKAKVKGLVYPQIIGCVDYQFKSGGEHHQTGFVFFLMKKGTPLILAPNMSFSDVILVPSYIDDYAD